MFWGVLLEHTLFLILVLKTLHFMFILSMKKHNYVIQLISGGHWGPENLNGYVVEDPQINFIHG